jgi:hypothetical protein
MARALSQAYLSECRWRHGACITKGSIVVATSPNLWRNSPDIDCRNSTYHAEVAALRILFRSLGLTYAEPADLSEYTMHVARIDIRNQPSMSRPCENCWEVLAGYNIRDVYYTNELGGLSHESIMW